MSDEAGSTRGGLWWLRAGLVGVAVVGLAIDAFVHLNLASDYDGVKSSVLTQGDLFRAESSLAIIAALLLLLRPRRWTAVIAFLVSAGGFALVLIYQYVNVGAIGPLPNMYDPITSGEKWLSIYAEGVAAVVTLILIFVAARMRTGGSHEKTGEYARAGA